MRLDTSVLSTVIANGSGGTNTLIFRSWLDPTNTPSGRPDADSSVLQGPFPLAGSSPLKFTGPPITVDAVDRYSLTMRVAVVLQPGAAIRTTAESTATVVPEPSTLALALSAMIPSGCCLWWRSRRKGRTNEKATF